MSSIDGDYNTKLYMTSSENFNKPNIELIAYNAYIYNLLKSEVNLNFL